MFLFKLLEVNYIKNKKSGKRSGNIMIQKLNNSALGTPTWEPNATPLPAPLDHQGIVT